MLRASPVSTHLERCVTVSGVHCCTTGLVSIRLTPPDESGNSSSAARSRHGPLCCHWHNGYGIRRMPTPLKTRVELRDYKLKCVTPKMNKVAVFHGRTERPMKPNIEAYFVQHDFESSPAILTGDMIKQSTQHFPRVVLKTTLSFGNYTIPSVSGASTLKRKFAHFSFHSIHGRPQCCWEHAFANKNDYNSIRLVKSASYQIHEPT